MLSNFDYVRARSLREAIDHLGAGNARIHAGGVDLLGCLHDGILAAEKLVSLTALQELRGIRKAVDGGVSIGALTTIREVAEDPLIRGLFPGLSQAASQVASPQLRNQATLGGNLCQRPRCWYFRGQFQCAKKGGAFCYSAAGENRYHAIFGGGPCYSVHPSDTAPMLVALGASLRIVGPTGERTTPLEDFFVLPQEDLAQENNLEKGEIVIEILLPPPGDGLHSSYRKVRERGAWDFALASVALALRMRSRKVISARVVLGGVAPVPWHSTAVEDSISGRELDAESIRAATEAAGASAEPLEQNGYKLPLVKGILEQALHAV
jgi:xanthine dehydrogenase YagS FAD-binding subunit